MIDRIKFWWQQVKYTRYHRQHEQDDMFRLMRLTDTMPSSFIGYRPWCDTMLMPCPSGDHRYCCECAHEERHPSTNKGY